MVVNETKHTSTVLNENKYGTGMWADPEIDWADSIFFWDAQARPISDETKHIVSITNEQKS
jgi:hypothetical protein